MPYDQLDSMSEARSILDNSTVIHNSRRPLRWIANWAGSKASAAVMRAVWLDEYDVDRGIRQTINSAIYRLLWPIYQKYGTFYKLDMEGPGWDDYNENGVPYWEEFHWDFIDEETGDAFKVINYGQ